MTKPYECQDCGAVFRVEWETEDIGRPMFCPGCGSKEIEKL